MTIFHAARLTERMVSADSQNGSVPPRKKPVMTSGSFKSRHAMCASWQYAAKIERAAKTVHNMRWFEVIDTRGHIDEGKVSHWQVSIKVGFTLDEV